MAKPSPKPRTAIPLRVHFALFGFVLLAPVLVLSVFALDEFGRSTTVTNERRLVETARAISANVDRDISGMFETLEALATSRALEAGDYATFHEEARQALRRSTSHLLLLDTSLNMLVNTRVEFGTPLPTTSDPESARAAIETKQRTVSKVFFGVISERMVFNVILPVERGGEVVYLLVMIGEPARMWRIVEQQGLPEGWVATVTDQEGALVARSTGLTESDIKPEPGAAAGGIDGAQQTRALDPDEGALSGVHRSTLTGWTTSVSAPREVLEEPLSRLWDGLFLATGIAVLLTLVLTFLFAQPPTQLILGLVRATKALGRGEPLPSLPSRLAEAAQAEEALQQTERELQLRQAALRDSERRLALAHETAGLSVIDFDFAGKRVTVTDNFVELFGFRPVCANPRLASRDLLALVLPADRERVSALMAEVVSREGRFRDEFRIVREDDRVVWVSVQGETLTGADGRVARLLVTSRDITPRKQMETHLRLVSREVSHRSKNLLAVVQAMARQTAANSPDTNTFWAAFAARLQGLAGSYDLLIGEQSQRARLDDLVRAQLAPFVEVEEGRVEIDGPEVWLGVAAVQALGLALHELATNAVKHGSLSVVAGRLSITWSLQGSGAERSLRLSWVERGGPRVSPPQRTSFGHVVIRDSLAMSFGAQVSLEFAPEGFRWTVEIALARLAPKEEE